MGWEGPTGSACVQVVVAGAASWTGWRCRQRSACREGALKAGQRDLERHRTGRKSVPASLAARVQSPRTSEAARHGEGQKRRPEVAMPVNPVTPKQGF